MPSDPSKPLLRVVPEAQPEPRVGRASYVPRPDAFERRQQAERFGPKFDRLREVLERGPEALSLLSDPSALAPERLLVFELRCAVSSFITAIKNTVGQIEFIDEEELVGDESDKSPVAYLLVPDMTALRQIESLWRRWNDNQELGPGNAGWRDVFGLLRELRPWGPRDRVDSGDAGILAEEIEGRRDDELVRMEIEFVFRGSEDSAAESERTLRNEVQRLRGSIVARARIESIGYHAILVDLPVQAVRDAVAQQGIATLESIMHIRPQSIADSIDVSDAEGSREINDAIELGSPILALLDGVPVARHPLLSTHVVLHDLFDLEPSSLVSERKHGTAMASLIVHGDRNLREATLPRKIHVLPVLSAQSSGAVEQFPADRLIVDVIYSAVRAMREGTDAAAPDVLVVTLCLGNPRQAFHGRLSAWAKLLDRLAYDYGILFVISAGNVTQRFPPVPM